MQGTSPVPLNLLLTWATARSRSRGLPAPVLDGDAVRVDTGLPNEARRYIFPAATPALSALAATIREPRILLKLCAPLPELMALLPPGWQAHPQEYFMLLEGAVREPAMPLPAGYTIAVDDDAGVVLARAIAADGSVAARGRAVAVSADAGGDNGLFVYDQIATDPDHRRRGLGSHVMRALETAGRGERRQALTATAAGHALYTALGWTTASLYSTAEFGASD